MVFMTREKEKIARSQKKEDAIYESKLQKNPRADFGSSYVSFCLR